MIVSPLSSRVVQRLRGRLPLEAASVRCVQAAPAVVVSEPHPAEFAPADLDRIVAADSMSTISAHMRVLRGTTEFGPSMAYLLPPTWMVDGNIARGRLRYEMNVERERLIVPNGDLPTLDGAAFASTAYGNKFFGHHVLDDLPTAVLGSRFGEVHYVNPPGRAFPHVSGYRQVLDLERPTVWTARTVRSWVFHDPFINDSKLARLIEFRSRIRHAAATGARGPRRVFLRRGKLGAQRSATNEDALEEALVADGWTFIDPESMPVTEIHAALGDADVVAGVEGSHFAHAILAQEVGRSVVVLMPPNRFNLTFKDYFDRLGIRYGMSVGEMTEHGWRIDVDGFRRVVERMDSGSAP